MTIPKKVHTGHCIPRVTGGLLLYYHLDMLRPQCYTCNRNRGGEGALFLYKLIGELGHDKISMLIGLRRQEQKPTRVFFATLLEEYKGMLKKSQI